MSRMFATIVSGLTLAALVARGTVATSLCAVIAGRSLLWLIMLTPLGAALRPKFRFRQTEPGR